MPEQPKFKRILLKISGESLTGEKEFGIDASILNKYAIEVNGKPSIRSKWMVDNNIPLFSEDPNYIEKYLETIDE